MTRLLVSVRSAAEAEAALAGGAALIDVKEPDNGPLGRAADATITEVVRAVAGRLPVSAALGELLSRSREGVSPVAALAYVKWGLAGCLAGGATWQRELRAARREVEAINPDCRVVVAAYADWQRAGSPRPEDVCSFAADHPPGVFLLDTWGKDGSTLLDWLDPAVVSRLCEHCRAAGVRVALAGSLGPAEIRALRDVGADWFAVRGAVCRGGRRGAAVQEGRVRRLVELLAAPLTEAPHGS